MLLKTDLKNVIYGYQIDQITDNDDDIVNQAIAMAVEEVRSYFVGNNKKEWQDGRIIYDVEAIFNATGTDRNALILGHCATVAKWYIVELCNADIIYEQAKDRYDRTISFLKDLASGKLTLDTLSKKQPPRTTETEDTNTPFTYGSRKKFNHE